jgi:hypothetical protein
MTQPRLPSGFADLEPFVDRWCLATERERYARRLATPIEEMRAFYAAVFPRVQAALEHCDRFPLDDMPEDSTRLLRLVHSFIMVSFPVEVWGRPRIPDTGEASLERVIEPSP